MTSGSHRDIKRMVRVTKGGGREIQTCILAIDVELESGLCDKQLSSTRIAVSEISTLIVESELAVTAYNIFCHHLVCLLTIIDQYCDISMIGKVLGVFVCIKNDTNAHEFLLISMQISFNIVSIVHNPHGNSISKELFALTTDTKL